MYTETEYDYDSEITTNTKVTTKHYVISRTPGSYNHASFAYTRNPLLLEMNRKLENARSITDYYKPSAARIKKNNCKKALTWFCTAFILIQAAAVVYWSLSGKQTFEDLTLLRYFVNLLAVETIPKVLKIGLLIILLPTIACAVGWKIIGFLPSPINLIARLIGALIIGCLAGFVYEIVYDKLHVNKSEKKSMKTLNKEFQEASNVIKEIENDNQYIKMVKEDEEKEKNARSMFEIRSPKWHEVYLNWTHTHSIGRV